MVAFSIAQGREEAMIGKNLNARHQEMVLIVSGVQHAPRAIRKLGAQLSDHEVSLPYF